MDGGAWEATVHGVATSRTRLSDLTYLLSPVVDIPKPQWTQGPVVTQEPSEIVCRTSRLFIFQ